MIRAPLLVAPVLVLAALAGAARAGGDRAVSANDGKQVLVDGRQVVPASPAADGVSIIEFGEGRLRLAGSVAVPTSVIGPPGSIAVTPDGRLAVVSSARRVAAGGADIEADDMLSVVDLAAGKAVSSLHLGRGAGPAGVAIDASGTRVLVAGRASDAVLLLRLERGILTPLASLPLGPGASPAQPMFLAGGHRALVSRDGDHRVALVAIEGDRLRLEDVVLHAGLRPYALDVARTRPLAVVGAIGGGGRDIDTISLIDLAGAAPRVVDTVAVGLTPEGVSLSPDGRHVAVSVNNGSNLAPSSPQYHRQGLLQVWRTDGSRLTLVAQAAMGGWGQGMAWSRDGRTILAQAARDRIVESFAFDGTSLRRTGALRLPAAPAAIAAAGR